MKTRRNIYEQHGKTATGKAIRVVQNIYGNWYGYISGRKVEWFSGWDAEGDAMKWFYANNKTHTPKANARGSNARNSSTPTKRDN